jgi:hypothetical protein
MEWVVSTTLRFAIVLMIVSQRLRRLTYTCAHVVWIAANTHARTHRIKPRGRFVE